MAGALANANFANLPKAKISRSEASLRHMATLIQFAQMNKAQLPLWLCVLIGAAIIVPAALLFSYQRTASPEQDHAFTMLQHFGYVSRSPVSGKWSVAADGTGVSDTEVALIGTLGRLDTIDLKHNVRVTDFGVDELLAHCQCIDGLNLINTGVSGSFLRRQYPQIHLKHLMLNAEASSQLIPNISKWADLEEFCLDGVTLTAADVETLVTLPHLHKCYLVRCTFPPGADQQLTSGVFDLMDCVSTTGKNLGRQSALGK